MIDYFSIFHEAHLVYKNLQRENPLVDVSVPSFESSPLKLDITVRDSLPSEFGSLSPLAEYEGLSKTLRGNKNEVEDNLRTIIGKLKSLPVSLYHQLADILDQKFFSREASLFKEIASAVQNVSNSDNNIMVSVKWDFPVRVTATDVENGKAAVLDFCKNECLLSGFAKPESVNKDYFKVFDMNVKVQNELISECLFMNFDNFSLIANLRESLIDYEQKSSDDILDSIIQKLVYEDYLVTLQEVLIEDDSILLCFDPILNREDIDIIVTTIKQAHPQATLIMTPDSEDSSWWVVEVRSINTMDVAMAGSASQQLSPENMEKGVIAKTAKEPMADLAKEVNIDKALTSIAKG